MTFDIAVPARITLKKHSISHRNITDSHVKQIVREQCAKAPSCVLMSGGPADVGRYSIIASDPLLIFKTRGNACEIKTSRGKQSFNGDPLEVLDALLSRIDAEFPEEMTPFCGGAVGYFAYEFKNEIEQLPQSALDDLQLPDIFLFFPSRIQVHDREKGELHELILTWEDEKYRSFSEDSVVSGDNDDSLSAHKVSSNFSKDEYCSAVEKIREYILDGDVYQVNLTQRLSFHFGSPPEELWLRLFEQNPSPYYAYINAGDHAVMSTSMECFLKRRGQRIISRPIKGTRPRGQTEREDNQLQRELLSSGKDDAELSMIVDLIRNDLGKVCEPGSIAVSEHKRLESYANVHHLVSTVEGKVTAEASIGDILRATFPGGSITGCPKIRAMEIIDELEPHVRHVYTGAIGYLGFHGNYELNVAIRTIVGKDGIYHFGAGGGVVFDSDPETEYKETLHKADTLLRLIGKGGDVNE